ncbi:MAG: hypothetical protein ACLU92_02080 [Coprococcus comes]
MKINEKSAFVFRQVNLVVKENPQRHIVEIRCVFQFYRRKRNDKVKIQKSHVAFLATLMCVTTFAGIGSTTAYAASGEKADVYMVDFPRDGDANYDGVWGHSNLTLKNGWHTGRSNFTNLKAIGSYSGNVAYCIEPNFAQGRSDNE